VLDAANNISWRATGLSLTGATTCDQSSVAAASKSSYVYDTRNRVTGIGFGDGSPSIGKSYTADGLVHTVVSNGSTWTYTYNNHRLLTQESLNFNSTVYNIGWGYDANGHMSQLTYPNGTVVAYSPNALGEATQASGYASAVTYQPNGDIAGYTLANGIVHSQTQNVRGLPAVNADVGMLQDAYTYDRNGNVTAITDQLAAVTTRSMAYDGLDRLTAANDPNVWGSGSYSYDPLDNIRTSVVGTRSSVMNYNAATNRLTGIVTNGVTTGYAYDNQGNITGRGSESFTFDEANRLKQTTGIETYTYDGLGRRTSINGSNGVNRVHVYDQAGQLLWWVQTQGTTTQLIRYVYLGKTPIAATSSTSGTNFMHTDALGSTVANSLPSGGLISRTRYEAYGRVAAGTAPTGLGFTGHVNDPSTGLVYMQHRYYDPVAGRFLSVDPIATDANAGSFNRYTYVDNDPYGKTDPTGEADEQIDEIVVQATRPPLSSLATITVVGTMSAPLRLAQIPNAPKSDPTPQKTAKELEELKKKLAEALKEKIKDSLKEKLREQARKAGLDEGQICLAEHCIGRASPGTMSACEIEHCLDAIENGTPADK
jgi:RHS repeat-associated protein